MRFSATQKLITYLMVLTSQLALLSSRELPLSLAALAALATILSWFWEPPRVDPRRFQGLWTALTLATFLYVAGSIVVGLNSFLHAGAQFVLLLGLIKLFDRKESRDDQQLYLLSFLQIIAASVLGNDLGFGLLFLLYVITGTWALILLHLRREIEENALLKYAEPDQGKPVHVARVLNSRKLINGRFLAVTGLLSLVIFAGALLAFFAFPRVGFGYFTQKQRDGLMMAGFSERVELGQHGTIRDDPTVVLRVEFPDGGRDRLPHYWRGIAFDHYDGHRWTQSKTRSCQPAHDDQARAIVSGPTGMYGRRCQPRAPTPVDEAQLVAQRIYLEPLDSRVLFSLPGLVRVGFEGASSALLQRFERRSLELNTEGDVRYHQRDRVALRYMAFSEVSAPAAPVIELSAYREALPEPIRARYLQLPEALDPQIEALAAQIFAEATTLHEAVSRLESHLRREYQYSLDLERDTRLAPLEDFLFVQKKGHCEYFATAMVILLRTQGIAARNVNGFLGGTWNDYGQYLAVSQGDAHSWVEVWSGEVGWRLYDPTPADPRGVARLGLLDHLSQYLDALRLRWYQHVVEYSLSDQYEILTAVREGLRRLSMPTLGGAAQPQRVWVGGVGLVVLVGLAIFLWRRRRGAASGECPELHEITAIYRSFLIRYGKLGYTKAPEQTALEFLQRLEREGAPWIEVARPLTERYLAVRYGAQPIDAATLQALRRSLREIRKPRGADAPPPGQGAPL